MFKRRSSMKSIMNILLLYSELNVDIGQHIIINIYNCAKHVHS